MPEIVRKSQLKQDHSSEISRSLVVVNVRISNYAQLICQGQSEQQIFTYMQAIYSGLDQLVMRHGLMRVLASEDQFEVVGGLKLFE